MEKKAESVIDELRKLEPVKGFFLYFERVFSPEGEKFILKDFEEKKEHFLILGKGWITYESSSLRGEEEKIFAFKEEPGAEKILERAKEMLERYEELKKLEEKRTEGGMIGLSIF